MQRRVNKGFQGINFVNESSDSAAGNHNKEAAADIQTYDPPPAKKIGEGPYSNPFGEAPAHLQDYSLMLSNRNVTMPSCYSSIGKHRMKDEDSYFDEDESEEVTKKNDDSDKDSVDPLDAFMEDVEKQVKSLDAEKTGKSKNILSGKRDDFEKEDEMEEYLRFMEENPNVGVFVDDEDDGKDYIYDNEGNIVGAEKKVIDPLPNIDHGSVQYAPFEKNFYVEHEEIGSLSCKKVQELRENLGIRTNGIHVAKPVCSFAHFNFEEDMLDVIRKAGFVKPSPIQAQAVPVALSGRDIIGIAKTGSGKTAAYLWPMLVHIMHQPELAPGDGPIALICAPTRELSQQINAEVKKLTKIYDISVACAFGGGNLWDQQKACEAGCEILVCTPGRLIDLIKKKSTNLLRATYLVFDEADKMFNLGFEPQVRSIANHVRPDRQTLLFSATFKKRVEKLARDILRDPVRIIQGELGEANEDITQVIELFDKLEDKLSWLFARLVQFTIEGSVLIFVTRKLNCVDVADKLRKRDFDRLGVIHGDMHQSERNSVIQAFKQGETNILVATDVAARGLDIPSIRTVVNYEMARDIDTHTHRIGRTGRAGMKGTAYSLLTKNTPSDKEFAPHLVRNLEASNQWVPPFLLDFAMLVNWFNDTRNTQIQGDRNSNQKNFKNRRLGLGASSSSSVSKPKKSDGPMSSFVSNTLQTNRLNAMKGAFQNQYTRMFVSAGVDKTNYVYSNAPSTSDNNSNRKRKSRWD